MGAPSDDQINECIASGLARGLSEDEIVRQLATLERLTDEELAALGVFPPPPRSNLSPSLSPTPPGPSSPSGRHFPRAAHAPRRERG